MQSDEAFRAENAELLNTQTIAKAALDEAKDAKKNLESQITVLEDLLITNDDESIIEEINGRIEGFNGDIEDAQLVIDGA
jgi:hypothetical protein